MAGVTLAQLLGTKGILQCEVCPATITVPKHVRLLVAEEADLTPEQIGQKELDQQPGWTMRTDLYRPMCPDCLAMLTQHEKRPLNLNYLRTLERNVANKSNHYWIAECHNTQCRHKSLTYGKHEIRVDNYDHSRTQACEEMAQQGWGMGAIHRFRCPKH